ncbi:UNVERIFIED_CONTAM: hypothetical protein HHA_217830 [Hammondia hammondi]|eukprot:XP_008889260.1 hypothetical protein HHA_217830 [Hammondia hammondi]
MESLNDMLALLRQRETGGFPAPGATGPLQLQPGHVSAMQRGDRGVVANSTCEMSPSASFSAPNLLANSRVSLDQGAPLPACPTPRPGNPAPAAAATPAVSPGSGPGLPSLLVSLNRLNHFLRVSADAEQKTNILNPLIGSLRLLQERLPPGQPHFGRAPGSLAFPGAPQSGVALPSSSVTVSPRLHAHRVAQETVNSLVQKETRAEQTSRPGTREQLSGRFAGQLANAGSAAVTEGSDRRVQPSLSPQERQKFVQLLLQECMRRTAGLRAPGAPPAMSAPSRLTPPGRRLHTPEIPAAAEAFPAAAPVARPVNTPSPPDLYARTGAVEGLSDLSPSWGGNRGDHGAAQIAAEQAARERQWAFWQQRHFLACQALPKNQASVAQAAYLSYLSRPANGTPYSHGPGAQFRHSSEASPAILSGPTEAKSSEESPCASPLLHRGAGKASRGRSTGPAGSKGSRARPVRLGEAPHPAGDTPAVKLARKRTRSVSDPKKKRQRQAPEETLAPEPRPEENAEAAAATAAAVAAAVADAVVVSPTGAEAHEDFSGWVRRSVRPSRPTFRVRCADCGGRTSQCQCRGRFAGALHAQRTRLCLQGEAGLETSETGGGEGGDSFPSSAPQNNLKKRRVSEKAASDERNRVECMRAAREGPAGVKGEPAEGGDASPLAVSLHRGKAAAASRSTGSRVWASAATAETRSGAPKTSDAARPWGGCAHAMEAFESHPTMLADSPVWPEKAPERPGVVGKKRAPTTRPALKQSSPKGNPSRRHCGDHRPPDSDIACSPKSDVSGHLHTPVPKRESELASNLQTAGGNLQHHRESLPKTQTEPCRVQADDKPCLRLVSPFFASLSGLSSLRTLQVHRPRPVMSEKTASRTARLLSQACVPPGAARKPGGGAALVWGPWKPRGVLEEAEKQAIHLDTLTEEYHKSVRLICQQGAYVLTAVGASAIVAAAAVAHAVKAIGESEDENASARRRKRARLTLHSRDFPRIAWSTVTPSFGAGRSFDELGSGETGEQRPLHTRVKREAGKSAAATGKERGEREGATEAPEAAEAENDEDACEKATPANAEAKQSICGEEDESATGTKGVDDDWEGTDRGRGAADGFTSGLRRERSGNDDSGSSRGKAYRSPSGSAAELEEKRWMIYPRMARDALCFLAAERQTESAQQLLCSPADDEEVEIPCGFAFSRLPTAAELDGPCSSDSSTSSGTSSPPAQPPSDSPAMAFLALSWCKHASANRDILKAVLVAAGCSLFACSSFSGFFFFRPSAPVSGARKLAPDPAGASLRAAPFAEPLAGREGDACAGSATRGGAGRFAESSLHACGMLWSLLRECGGVPCSPPLSKRHRDLLWRLKQTIPASPPSVAPMEETVCLSSSLPSSLSSSHSSPWCEAVAASCGVLATLLQLSLSSSGRWIFVSRDAWATHLVASSQMAKLHFSPGIVHSSLRTCELLRDGVELVPRMLSAEVVASLHADILHHFGLLMDRVLTVHQHWPIVPPATSLFKYNGVACRNSPLRVDVNLSEAHWEWGDGELRRAHLQLQQRVLLLTRLAGTEIGKRFGSWQRPSSASCDSSFSSCASPSSSARSSSASCSASDRETGARGDKQERHLPRETGDRGREEAWRSITFGYIVSIGPHANDQKVHHDYHQEAFERNIVNAFFPLVDISPENSATTFLISGSKIQSCAAAGDLILMDNTVRHYGSQHPAPTVRPLIYCSLADRRTTRTREAVGKKTHFYNWHQYPRLPGAKQQDRVVRGSDETEDAEDGSAPSTGGETLEEGRKDENLEEAAEQRTVCGHKEALECEGKETEEAIESAAPEEKTSENGEVDGGETRRGGTREKSEACRKGDKSEKEEAEHATGGDGGVSQQPTTEPLMRSPGHEGEKREQETVGSNPFISSSPDTRDILHKETASLPRFLQRILAYRQSLENCK